MKTVGKGILLKPETPEHGTTEHETPAEHRNIPEQWRFENLLGKPADHSTIPTEYQRNTSRTPRNNGIIQYKEQLKYF